MSGAIRVPAADTGGRRVIFVAGPYRAPTAEGVRANIERARAVALALWRAGHVALCPHLNSALLDREAPEIPDAVWLGGALALLERCDEVALVPGWEASEGTRGEIERARERGIPVYEWADGTGGGCEHSNRGARRRRQGQS